MYHEGMTIFVPGDRARYVGSAFVDDGVCLIPGDMVTIREGNEDYDDDVTVNFHGVSIVVPASSLEWVA